MWSADPLSEPVERDWGVYTGYFGDPDGSRWDVAYTPRPIGVLVLHGDQEQGG